MRTDVSRLVGMMFVLAAGFVLSDGVDVVGLLIGAIGLAFLAYFWFSFP